MTRRGLLASLAVLFPARAGAEAAAHLTVAGPVDGSLAQSAAALVEALRVGGGDAILVELVGTADGATGVNRFVATAVADGSDLLLLPGEALLAWLAGDPRARYEPARWVPLAAALHPPPADGGAAEVVRAADPALRAAGQAMRNAAQIAWMLVLPPLTDAAAAAAWRHRTGVALGRLRAREAAWQLLDAPEAAESLAAAVPDEAALLAYRGWMARRLTPG